jgi:hypothetical protein
MLMAVSATNIKADIMTSLTGVTADSSGGYDFNYQVDLTNNEELAASSSWAQFGTIYDVSSSMIGNTASGNNVYLKSVNYVAPGVSSSNVSWSSSKTDTPSVANITQSGMYDLRFTFNPGSTVVGASTANGTADIMPLFTFVLWSPTNTVITPCATCFNADGEATSSYGVTAGQETINAKTVGTPGMMAGVPEPASILLLGSGLLGIGFIGRRRSAKKA